MLLAKHPIRHKTPEDFSHRPRRRSRRRLIGVGSTAAAVALGVGIYAGTRPHHNNPSPGPQPTAQEQTPSPTATPTSSSPAPVVENTRFNANANFCADTTLSKAVRSILQTAVTCAPAQKPEGTVNQVEWTSSGTQAAVFNSVSADPNGEYVPVGQPIMTIDGKKCWLSGAYITCYMDNGYDVAVKGFDQNGALPPDDLKRLEALTIETTAD